MSKVAFKTVLAIAVGTVMTVSSAQAAIVHSISGPNAGDAEAAEASFLGNLQPGYVTEGFEGFVAGTQQPEFNTSVGRFSAGTPGSGGLCTTAPYSCDGGLAVLDSVTTPFSGRFAVGGNNWLDSMDYETMTFDVSPGNNSVGFFMTDPNDQGGRMDVLATDGSEYTLDLQNIFGGSQPNEGLFYLSFLADADISSLVFTANNPNDGYGIDNVTAGNVAAVPAPATLALLGMGLLGLGLSRCRKV